MREDDDNDNDIKTTRHISSQNSCKDALNDALRPLSSAISKLNKLIKVMEFQYQSM